MPKSVALIEPIAIRVAANLGRELAGQADFDFCDQFAATLAARLFGELLGMSPSEMVRVAQHIRDLAPMFLRGKDAQGLLAADRASRQFIDLIVAVADRALSGEGHLPFLQMAAELDAIRTVSDPRRYCIVLKGLGVLLAGNMMDAFHTSGVAASSAVFLLLMHPLAREQVQSDPKLLRPAVHEALRLLSPPTVTLKVALQGLELQGVRIRRIHRW